MHRLASLAAVAALALVLAVAPPAQADMSTCLVSGASQINFNGTEFVIGCSGYGNSVLITWTITTSTPLFIRFLAFQTEPSYDKVTITTGTGGGSYGPFSGSAIPNPILTGTGNIVVQFSSDASNTYPGFTIDVQTAPTIQQLVSGQTYSFTKVQQGGFVYFALSNYALGAAADFAATVYSYSGLQAPSVFIGRNRLPVLESYDYTNTTVQSGSNYGFRFTLPTPGDGTYYIGIFLYGTTSNMAVTTTWAFSVPTLNNGDKVTAVTTGVNYYQIHVPYGAITLNFQISRQVPGGFPIAYITQGVTPSAATAAYTLDTTLQSYQSLTIPSPNPYSNPNANPGNYIIGIATTSGSAGYIFQVTWQ